MTDHPRTGIMIGTMHSIDSYAHAHHLIRSGILTMIAQEATRYKF